MVCYSIRVAVDARRDGDWIMKLGELSTGGLLESLPDGAYITDLNRRIVYWNEAAERITGWRREDVVGRHCADNILCHVDKDGHLLCGHEHCPLHRSMVTCTPSTSPMLLYAQNREGSRIPVEVSVAPLTDPSGRAVGGIEVFRDMTPAMKELERAKLIQEHSLELAQDPDGRVRFAVQYTPQEVVGGDFYRVEAIGEDCFALLTADVMGHGMSAALYTMQFRALWEELRDNLHDPAAYLTELNNRLGVLTQHDDCFATALFLVMDARDGLVTYANAGHPQPIVVSAHGCPHRLETRGAAVGLFQDVSYHNTHTHLNHGDDLIVYTDGAIEVVSREDEELGVSGFSNLLSREKKEHGRIDLTRIEEQLLHFSNDLRLTDDLTLLIASRV